MEHEIKFCKDSKVLSKIYSDVCQATSIGGSFTVKLDPTLMDINRHVTCYYPPLEWLLYLDHRSLAYLQQLHCQQERWVPNNMPIWFKFSRWCYVQIHQIGGRGTPSKVHPPAKRVLRCLSIRESGRYDHIVRFLSRTWILPFQHASSAWQTPKPRYVGASSLIRNSQSKDEDR